MPDHLRGAGVKVPEQKSLHDNVVGEPEDGSAEHITRSADANYKSQVV